MKTILCYGDSNTYGYNPNLGRGSRYEKEFRWTTILSKLLGSDYEVIPEGLNGRTTAFDRPGFPWKNGVTHLPAIMGSHKPIDYLIFMLGTNDCNIEMHLNEEDISSGMEKLIQTAKEMSIIQQERIPEIVVIAPAPIREEIEYSPFYGEINIRSVELSKNIASFYERIAMKHNCRFIDAKEIEVSSIDCEHLTERGHRQLAELIYSSVFNNNL